MHGRESRWAPADGGVGGGVASVKCDRVEEGVLEFKLEVEKCLRGSVPKRVTKTSFNDTKTRAVNSLRASPGETGPSVVVLLSRLGDVDSGKGGMFSLFPSGFKSVNMLEVLTCFAVGVASGVGRSRRQVGESVEEWDCFPSTEPCMACYDGNTSRPG